MQTTKRGILDVFARQVRRVMSAFREKPKVVLDDYLMEHFMLYHGLVGTSPENQPRVKDVRTDIFDALKHGSSAEMCIGLKLPPLWWDDRLNKIFTEAREQRVGNITDCLLPAGGSFELAAESDPLRHPDWRVRANAARVLGQLQIPAAVPRMIAALNDGANDQKAGFCHIAYALSKLQTTPSKEALAAHLRSEEPWFRVDAAGALAFWPLQEVGAELMSAQLDPHALSDYMAVAVAKQHQPTELLTQSSDLLQEGALEVVIGLLQASQGTFSNDILIEARLHTCLPRVLDLARQHGTPRRWRAVHSLCDWIDGDVSDIVYQDRTASTADLRALTSRAREEFAFDKIQPQLLSWLKDHYETLNEGSQLRHAARLAAECQLTDAAPYMVSLAVPRSPAVNEAVDALCALGQSQTAPHLVSLAQQIVDINARTNRELTRQPVFEDNPAAAKTYWHVLKALGCLPGADAEAFLLRASNDFAADKRQQAIASLISLGQHDSSSDAFKRALSERIGSALHDPAAVVRTEAVKGVGVLGEIEHLHAVMKLVHAGETPIWRAAADSLRELHSDGHAAAVEQALTANAAQERNQFRRQRLRSLLESLKS